MATTVGKKNDKQLDLNFTISDIETIINMLKQNDVSEFCFERGSDKLW